MKPRSLFRSSIVLIGFASLSSCAVDSSSGAADLLNDEDLGQSTQALDKSPCPVLTRPAPLDQVQCKWNEDRGSRCGEGLSPGDCDFFNAQAEAHQLLQADALAWVRAQNLCAIVSTLPGNRTMLTGICAVGCFESSMRLMTVAAAGERAWIPASRITYADQLGALAADATLESPVLEPKPIDMMSKGKERNELFKFILTNGVQLKVTQHHGMVLSDGRVVEAQNVAVGHSFVDVDGTPVRVAAIEREATASNVYNFRVKGSTPQEHVIAAEGILIGDLRWQADLARENASIAARAEDSNRE